jgi:hypothetical protein
VDAIRRIDVRQLGGQWPDRELAVTMNRMRCKSPDSKSWTTVRVRELRERLEIPEFDPNTVNGETISADETARRLKISIGSVHLLIRRGVLPGTQLMPCAPWKVPLEALESGVRELIARRPRNFAALQGVKTLKLPGF